MSAQEPREAVADLIEENLRGIQVELLDLEEITQLSDAAVSTRFGSGKSEVLLRLMLTQSTRDNSQLLTLIRNALVHEGRLVALVGRSNPRLSVDTFLELLTDTLENQPRPDLKRAESQFTEPEMAELVREGVIVSGEAKRGGAAARTAAEFAGLITNSLTVSEAGQLMAVDPSRVRQRLTNRTLYGVKVGRAWRIPIFQFGADGQVRGLDQVLVVLPPTLHPVAVQRWLTTPLPDLELEGEQLSPLEWLKSTGDPAPVIEIARDL